MIDDSNLDHVDQSRMQWSEQRPDIDTSPMAILGRINRVALMAGQAIAASMAEVGLDRGEFDVLATLRRAGSSFALSPTELYTSLMLSSGGLSNRLRRMERKGLVGRAENTADGRGQLVVLSAKGLALVDEAFEADMKLEASLLQILGEQEQKQLEAALRMLCRDLENLPDNK